MKTKHMKNEKQNPFTPEEITALAPAFKKIDAAYRSLDRALARIRRPPLDDGGTTGICGTGCGCSSFDAPAPGTGNPNICARSFCRHHYRSHLT